MPIEVDYPGVGTVEFPDGTSEEEILEALKSLRPEEEAASDPYAQAAQPSDVALPENLAYELQSQQRAQEQGRALYGAGPFAQPGEDAGFTKALAFGTPEYPGIPEAIGKGLHAALTPVEDIAWMGAYLNRELTHKPILKAFGQPEIESLKPGESIFPGLAPAPESKGAIAEIRRAAAGLTTPGGIATLAVAPGSKLIQAGFGIGALASIPPSVQEFIEARDPAEKRGALANIGISAGFAGLIGHGMGREGRLQARRQKYVDRLMEQGKREDVEAVQLLNRIQELSKDPDLATDPAKQQELAALKEMWEQEDASGFLSDEQRELIGLTSFDPENLELDVAVVEGVSPLQKARRLLGQAFGINLRTGEIEIYADEFKQWWEQVEPAKREEALRRRLNEEQWHKRIYDALGKQGAAEFWNNMTAAEKLLFQKYYSGFWTSAGRRKAFGVEAGEFRELTPSDLGQEAIRMVMQMAEGKNTSEFVEATLRNQISLRTIETALGVIGLARRTLGTKALARQEELITQVEQNLLAARAAVSQREEEAPPEAEEPAPVVEPDPLPSDVAPKAEEPVLRNLQSSAQRAEAAVADESAKTIQRLRELKAAVEGEIAAPDNTPEYVAALKFELSNLDDKIAKLEGRPEAPRHEEEPAPEKPQFAVPTEKESRVWAAKNRAKQEGMGKDDMILARFEAEEMDVPAIQQYYGVSEKAAAKILKDSVEFHKLPPAAPKGKAEAPSAPEAAATTEFKSEAQRITAGFQEKARRAAQRRARVMDMGEDEMLLAQWELTERDVADVAKEYGLTTDQAADLMKKSAQHYRPDSPGGIVVRRLDQDQAEYKRITDRMTALIRAGTIEGKEFDSLKADLETVKNRWGGMPPGQVSPERRPVEGPGGIRKMSYREWRQETENKMAVVRAAHRLASMRGPRDEWPAETEASVSRVEKEVQKLFDDYPDYYNVAMQGDVGMPHHGPGTGPGGIRKLSYKKWQEELDRAEEADAEFSETVFKRYGFKTADWPEEVKRQSDQLSSEIKRLHEEYPDYSKVLARSQRYSFGGEGEPRIGPGTGPGGLRPRRGKREEERAELREKLRQMREAEKAGTMQPATEVGGIMFEKVTPDKARIAVDDFFSGKTPYAEASVTGRPVETKELGPGGEPVHKEKIEGPSFEKFGVAVKKQFGPMNQEAVRDLLFEHAGESLMKAPAARIIEILKGMRLIKRVVGGGRPGEKRLGAMAEPTEPVGQFHLFGDEREPLILTKLKNATLRARRAKEKEFRYSVMGEEARKIHTELRNFQKPEGKSSGPIWDVNERGQLVGRGDQPLPPEIQKKFQVQAGRLRNLRVKMDEILETKLKPGEKGEAIVPSPFEAGPPQKTHLETGHNLRLKSISVILHELFKQAEGTRKPLNRKEITAEDLGAPKAAKESVFARIHADELKNPTTLGDKLTADSRVNTYPGYPKGSIPRSITRRLVVAVDNRTGSVHMLDVWMNPARGAVVMNPGLAESHITLENLLKTHTPIYSVFLDEPVQNFKTKWKDVQTFDREFGQDALSRSRAINYEQAGIPFAPPPGTTGERATPGQFQGRPGFIETLETQRRQITDQEVRETWDYLFGEEQVFESPDAVLGVVEGLKKQVAEKGEAMESVQLPWVPITGLAKMMREAMRQDPAMTEGQALESVARWIYETNKRSETRGQFVERTLANYGGMVAEPGAGVTPETAALAASERAGEAAIAAQSIAKGEAALAAKPPPPLEREQTVAPGTLPAPGRAAEQLDIRQRQTFEQAFEEAMAAEIRQPRPPTGSEGLRRELPGQLELIHQQALKERVDDSYFDKYVIKGPAKVAREAEAELEAEFPKKAGESREQWLRRIQALHAEEFADVVGQAEEAARQLGEYRRAEQEAAGKVAKDQAEFGDNISPAGIIRYVLPASKTFTDLTGKTVGAGIRLGSEWMVDRLRRVTPRGVHGTVTRENLTKANQIISEGQANAGYLFNERRGDEILKESGRFKEKGKWKINKGTLWLNDVEPVTPFGAAISNTKAALEGGLRPPSFARSLTELAQQVNVYIGEFMEAVSPNFIANGGMAHNLTTFGYDVIRDGKTGPYWERWIRGNMRANSLRYDQVEALMLEYKRVLDEPAGDPSAVFAVNQDFVRKLPNAVTHIWTGPKNKLLGHWEPVVHSDLFGYFNHGIRRAGMIKAFREVYPFATDAATQQPTFNLIMKAMRAELPKKYHNLVNSLYRALQGHPTENAVQTGWLSESALERTPSITQPGGYIAQFLSPIGDTMKTAWLSRQFALQPAEIFTGGTSVFFGYDKAALGAFFAMKKNWKAMLETQGAMDRMLYNYSWNPNAPVRSAFRVFINNPIRKVTGFHFFNEWQEAQGAAAAYITAARIMASHTTDRATGLPHVTLTWTEKNLLPQTFRAMGFNRAEVTGLMNGDPMLLGQMVNKAPSFLTGGHKHPAEQSRLMANRTANKFLWFQQYPMTRLNQFTKLVEVTAENFHAKRYKEAGNSALLLGKFMGGTAVQGAIQTAFMAFVAGGIPALMMYDEEYDDEFFRFVFDGWLSAMGGPLQLMTRGWERAGFWGAANNMMRIAAPVNVASEVVDVLNGWGGYRDLDMPDRIGKYIGRQIPLSKTLKSVLAATGLSQDDPFLDQAIDKLSKWKIRTWEIEKAGEPTYWEDDDRENFRIQMKKAGEALRNGDRGGYLEARRAALGEKVAQTRERAAKAGVAPKKGIRELDQEVNRSLLARRVLRNPQTGAELTRDETGQLIEFIGIDAYRRLQSFDRMLEAQAGKFD